MKASCENNLPFFVFVLKLFISMSNKLTLEDIGKLVKPKILVEAYLLCNKEVDIGDWWKKVLALNASSISYKRDTIESIYGRSLDKLFSNLDVEKYAAVITSFVVFHQSRYQSVSTKQEIERILKTKKHYSIRAIGVKLYHSYDSKTKAVDEAWEPTAIPTIQWFYQPKHLINIEEVEAYESVGIGDMLAFKKTQALVTKVKVLKRKKFWATCSWTRKKITVLNGSNGNQVRLNVNRLFEVIKSKQT